MNLTFVKLPLYGGQRHEWFQVAAIVSVVEDFDGDAVLHVNGRVIELDISVLDVMNLISEATNGTDYSA